MLRRWLLRFKSLLFSGARALAAGAGWLCGACRGLNPSALYGLAGLACIFGGLACFSWPVAFVVTGLLMFLDATRPAPPAKPATP